MADDNGIVDLGAYSQQRAAERAAEAAEILDFYDDEMPLLLKAGERISAIKQNLDIESFSKAVVESYATAGFNVSVTFKVSEHGFLPKVTVNSRNSNNPHYAELVTSGFDHDRKRWEVQTDVLGGGKNAGALTRDGRIISPSKSTAFPTQKD